MSQNMPPNESDAGAAGNPYYQQAAGPDLDAATPVLKDEETQRLNRKALFFLGGTLFIVLLMAMLVLGSGGDGSSARAPEPEQSMAVPQLPRAVTERPQPEAPPIPVVDEAPVADMPPPLPAESWEPPAPLPPSAMIDPSMVADPAVMRMSPPPLAPFQPPLLVLPPLPGSVGLVKLP